MIKGRIHSFESFGTVDGPGIRFVVFIQGCLMRCVYCHNPDTWDCQGGMEYSAKEVFEKIEKYLPYITRSGGGVTVSGGEPLVQVEFVTELFKMCKQKGVHTAIDTSGFPIYPVRRNQEPSATGHVGDFDKDDEKISALLENTDLVLLDIKHRISQKHQTITGFSNEEPLRFAKILEEKAIPVWLRYVVVPGFTDDTEGLRELKKMICAHKNIEKVEVLPFHKMGAYKWKELGLGFSLDALQEATEEDVARVERLLGI